MECPKCGAENSDDLKFCGYCGSRIHSQSSSSGFRIGVRRLSEDPRVGFMPLAQRGIYWAEFPRKHGRVLFIMTPIKVSVLLAREDGGEFEMNPLLGAFGGRAKIKDFSTGKTVFETRVLYEGASPTGTERNECLAEIGEVLSSHMGSEVSSQAFLVTSSTELTGGKAVSEDSITVMKLGGGFNSLQ